MSHRSKLFLDTEFTGLHQQSSLISLAIVAEDGSDFYAEFTDYDSSQLNDWLRQNVMNQLMFDDWPDKQLQGREEGHWRLKGDRAFVANALGEYLQRFEQAECWVDYVAYDWVLFCEIFGGSMHLPSQLYYIPFDLPTLFKIKGIDPDISREEFVEDEHGMEDIRGNQHHALRDAKISALAYGKVMNLER